MSFGEYVHNKTIAIVGPATPLYDQTAEIDAHDLVYRCSYGFRWLPGMDANPVDDCWFPGTFPKWTGTRVDMSFYNGFGTRQIDAGNADAVLQDLDWAITKNGFNNPSAFCEMRPVGGSPFLGERRVNGNQVTLMLWDLYKFHPADVTVFGANFYAGSTTDWYDPLLMTPGWENIYDDPTEHLAPGNPVANEDQEDQRIIIRAIREERGWPSGDDRFLEALNKPAEQHQAEFLAEQARHLKLRGRL